MNGVLFVVRLPEGGDVMEKEKRTEKKRRNSKERESGG